jgi:hypothetical protein
LVPGARRRGGLRFPGKPGFPGEGPEPPGARGPTASPAPGIDGGQVQAGRACIPGEPFGFPDIGVALEGQEAGQGAGPVRPHPEASGGPQVDRVVDGRDRLPGQVGRLARKETRVPGPGKAPEGTPGGFHPDRKEGKPGVGDVAEERGGQDRPAVGGPGRREGPGQPGPEPADRPDEGPGGRRKGGFPGNLPGVNLRPGAKGRRSGPSRALPSRLPGGRRPGEPGPPTTRGTPGSGRGGGCLPVSRELRGSGGGGPG